MARFSIFTNKFFDEKSSRALLLHARPTTDESAEAMMVQAARDGSIVDPLLQSSPPSPLPAIVALSRSGPNKDFASLLVSDFLSLLSFFFERFQTSYFVLICSKK